VATITGTSGADILNGTTSADTINGLGGNDSLNGKAGNDTIKGGTGLDKVWGEAGNDQLWGDDGDDQVWGGTGNDIMYGGIGNDQMYGEAGTDTLKGGAGNDILKGGTGLDKLWGETGNDQLWGDDGDDQMWGGAGNDVMYGGIGNDSMYGDAGTDTLKGEAGNDILKGGTGLAYLYGGTGNDALTYDPTTGNLKDVGNYLSTSSLNGDAGTDTLNLYNKATYTDGAATKGSHTSISYDSLGKATILFDTYLNDYDSPYSYVGFFKGIEKVVVNGNGLTFNAWGAPSPIEVTGTEVADTFSSGSGNDTFIGRGGNDTFFTGWGTDSIVSGANDADIIYFGSGGDSTSVTTVTGVNHPGIHAGDKIYITEYYFSNPDTQVVEADGKTTFTTDYGEKLVVNTVGLVEGVDWFLT
jgi:Ca2+-binding RTX toxin-like protein